MPSRQSLGWKRTEQPALTVAGGAIACCTINRPANFV
jgi:hypothetical protein